MTINNGVSMQPLLRTVAAQPQATAVAPTAVTTATPASNALALSPLGMNASTPAQGGFDQIMQSFMSLFTSLITMMMQMLSSLFGGTQQQDATAPAAGSQTPAGPAPAATGSVANAPTAPTPAAPAPQADAPATPGTGNSGNSGNNGGVYPTTTPPAADNGNNSSPIYMPIPIPIPIPIPMPGPAADQGGSVNNGYPPTTPPAADNGAPTYPAPPAADNGTPTYPSVTPPATDTETPTYPAPPATDTETPVYPAPPATDTETPVYNTPINYDQDGAGYKPGNYGYTTPPSKDNEPPPAYDDTVSYDGKDNGNYWGDPHFNGFGGEDYDVQGQDGQTYNILTDQTINYNATFSKWGNDGATIVSDVGIQVGQSQVRYGRDMAAPTVDGQAMQDGQTLALDGGSASWQGGKLNVSSSEYTISLTKQAGGSNGDYLNSDVKINDGVNPLADLVGAHGLLGQTIDGDGKANGTGVGDKGAGAQGGGVIQTFDANGSVVTSQKGDTTAVNNYKVDGLFGTMNNQFNRFGVQVDQQATNALRQDIDGDGDLDITQVIGNNGAVLLNRPVAAPAGQAKVV